MYREFENFEKQLNTEEHQHQINEDEKELEKNDEELDVIDKKVRNLKNKHYSHS